nr:DNA-binding response regulator [Aeromicrobium sp.]
MIEAVGTTLGRIASSAYPLSCRASALLAALRSAVPFDAAWMASGPHGGRYTSLASVGLTDEVACFLGGDAMAQDVAAAGGEGGGMPVSRSSLFCPASDLAAWADCLAPAGMHESLSVGLSPLGGRHIGLLILLFKSTSPSSRTTRRRLAALAPALALGIDPMPGLLAVARTVRGVTAGAVLRDDGLIEPLPGLHSDQLLAVGSPVLAIASQRLSEGLLYSSFLWPLGGRSAPDGHARITVVAAPEDVPAALIGMALMSPSQNLHGLTPRELEVLGLVIDGCSNQEIAQTLFVAPRTVAAHIEHLLVKLEVRTRTTAAVRAEREGLYVPSVAGLLGGGAGLRRPRELAAARPPPQEAGRNTARTHPSSLSLNIW